MTASITPVSRFLATLPPRATAGERMMMDGGTAPLRDILLNLYDRTELARDGVSGALVWAEEFSIDPGGSNSSFAINVGAIQSVVLCDVDAANYSVYSKAATVVDAASIESVTGVLNSSAWHYLYAKPGTSGQCAFEISTTAPRANKVFKTGSGYAYQSRRYLGAFRTDSNGAPYPMRCVRGRALYRRSAVSTAYAAISSGGFRTSSNVPVGSITSLDLADRVPPHARLAIMSGDLTVFNDGTGTPTASELTLYAADDTAAGALIVRASAGSTVDDEGYGRGAIDLETTAAQKIGYKATRGTHCTFGWSIDVLGWAE